MEYNFFDFTETREALSQLSSDVIELENTLRLKKQKLETENHKILDELKDREAKIKNLNLTINNAITKIDGINKYIEEVL
jgi:hypothetical protein